MAILLFGAPVLEMLSRELERNLQGILERVPANYIAAIVGAWVASRFVYKLFGCTMMHTVRWLWIPASGWGWFNIVWNITWVRLQGMASALLRQPLRSI